MAIRAAARATGSSVSAPDEAAVQRLVDQAVEQGLPRFVEDESVIRRVAAVVRSAEQASSEAAA